MKRNRRAAAWSATQAAASLAELAYIERALAHILAGWAVKAPEFAVKRAFGLQMHRSMERAMSLRGRVNGLCHAVAEEGWVPAGLRSVFHRLDQAVTPAQLLGGIYAWLYPRLIGLYEAHLRQTDPDGDGPSIALIGGFLPAVLLERRERLGLVPRGDQRAWFRELEGLWSGRSEGEPLPLADALWPPVDRAPAAARPAGAQRPPAGSLGLFPVDPLHDPRDIGLALHKELDEEYTTLELMGRNAYEHPDMPWAFHRDMMRQASDEARHAAMIERLLEARGFRHGDFPISTSSYDGLYEFEPCEPGGRKELLWRLLIRQTFMEGLAVDHLAREIERRRGVGQDDIAAVFEFILRDEVFHVQSGLRWSRELLGSDPKAALDERAEAMAFFTARAEAAREAFVMDDLDAALGELATIEARGGDAPDRRINRAGRLQAGYTEEDIRQVIAWGYVRED